MRPNLEAQLKSWLSIMLFYLQAEEMYVTVVWYWGTEKPVFLLSTGSSSKFLKIVIQIIKITSLRNQRIEKLQGSIYLGVCLYAFKGHILKENYLKYLYSEFSD